MPREVELVFKPGTREALTAVPCVVEQATRWYLKGLVLALGLDEADEPRVVRARVQTLELTCFVDPLEGRVCVLSVHVRPSSTAFAATAMA